MRILTRLPEIIFYKRLETLSVIMHTTRLRIFCREQQYLFDNIHRHYDTIIIMSCIGVNASGTGQFVFWT